MALVRPTLLPIDHWTEPDRGFATMRVTSPYGPRPGGFHAAIDVGNARLGDVLVAAGKGEVIARGYIGQPWTDPKPSDAWWLAQPATDDGKRGGLYGPPSEWEGPMWGGQMIVIQSGEYYLSYAHCRTITVTVGQKVAPFQQIGTVGDSGSAYRQGHLHFGVRRGNLWVDPWPLISQTAQLPDTALPLEDDMSAFGTGTIAPGVNLRDAPSLAGGINFQTTELTSVDLMEYVADGGAYSAGGQTRTDWFKVARNSEHWCAAAFVGNRKSPLFPSGGYTADDLAKAKAEGEKIGAINIKTKAVVEGEAHLARLKALA